MGHSRDGRSERTMGVCMDTVMIEYVCVKLSKKMILN